MGKVTADHIVKNFGSFRALDHVSIELEEKQIFGLLGSNGAGKSTLIKIMTGLLTPDEGSVKYFDFDLFANYGELKTIFSVVPQEISCYHGFTVRQNLEFFGLMHNIRAEVLDEKIKHLLEWFALKEFENKPIEELSGGYKRLINIACSLVHDPLIIFLDEPTVGLDPSMRRMLWQKIKELKESGKTICLTTHYLDEAQSLCDKVGLLVNGRLLVSGPPMQLIQKYGGYRILVMKLSAIIKEEDAAAVKNTFEGAQVEIVGPTIVVSFSQEHSIEKIALLTQWLTSQGYGVLSSVIKEPELEDVFLNITGERLRN